MKRDIKRFQVLLQIVLLVLIACKSTKTSQGHVSNQNQVKETVNECDKTIRYYIDKFIMVKDGQEVTMPTEIVINPKAKLITLTSKSPNEENVSFDTEIESIDCELNNDLTKGQSTYRGYIKRNNGTSTLAVLKVEAKEGGLTISNGDPNQPAEYFMHVAKWELIKE